MLRAGPESQPVVRLVAVNRSEVEHAPHPLLGMIFVILQLVHLNLLLPSSLPIIRYDIKYPVPWSKIL